MDCPIPNARGVLRPEGTGANGVLILGEAMGEDEAYDGLPFRPHAQSGSVLERAIRKIGTNREQYVIWNVVPTHPPNNYLEGAPYCSAAIEWGRPQLEDMIARYRPRCILALGNIATRTLTGLAGPKMGVTHITGYVLPSRYGVPVVACLHPAFLRRGKMSHFGVLLRCLRLAIQIAREQRQALVPPVDDPPLGYILRPTRDDAYEFECAVRELNPTTSWLSYDIETMYSTDEEDAEENPDAIRSIQFSIAPGSGIYLPWREPFMSIAKRILALRNRKCGWNNWRFDDPLLRANGCTIGGENHDLMWAWHHSQPDLSKPGRGLQFAAAMQGPSITQPSHSWPWPWKHLDSQSPEFYGIVDVDVLQWMVSYKF